MGVVVEDRVGEFLCGIVKIEDEMKSQCSKGVAVADGLFVNTFLCFCILELMLLFI